MFTKLNTRRKAIPVRSLVVAIAVAILAVTVAYAANITIDTDDTDLDSDWYATAYVTDPNDAADTIGVPDDMDIEAGWLAQDATSLYFRIEVHDEAIIFTGSVREAWAQIDCDVNGSVEDDGDRWVIYRWQNNSEYSIRITKPDGTLIRTYDLTYGERPDEAANDDNIEWKASETDLGSGCFSDSIRVQFHTDNKGDPQDDTTSLGGTWNPPTAVTLQDFRAHGASGPDGGMAAAIGLVGIGALGAVALARRRK